MSGWIRVLSAVVEEPPSGVNDPGRGVTEVGGYAVATGLWVSRDYIIIIIVEETVVDGPCRTPPPLAIVQTTRTNYYFYTSRL